MGGVHHGSEHGRSLASKWNQHFSVECAGKYFQVHRMRSHSGTIDKLKALAAMVVVIQNAPIQSVRRVHAATTVAA
eukprot:3507249-Karenia_brevis.AAC.1